MLRLIGCVRGTLWTETEIHQQLRGTHTHGEWYRVSSRLKDVIEERLGEKAKGFKYEMGWFEQEEIKADHLYKTKRERFRA